MYTPNGVVNCRITLLHPPKKPTKLQFFFKNIKRKRIIRINDPENRMRKNPVADYSMVVLYASRCSLNSSI